MGNPKNIGKSFILIFSGVLFMTQQNILELAKQGDVKAIASLMNRQLQPKGITAKVVLKQDCLQVMLESEQPQNQQTLVTFVCKGITGLGIESIKRVHIYGRQMGEEFPDWSQNIELVSKIPTDSIPKVSYQSKNQSQNLINPITADDYRTQGEKEILYGSLGVLGFIFFILLGVSFGLILLMLAASAFWVKIRQAQLLGKAVKVSEYQLTEVYQAAKISAQRLNIKMPDVFVVQSPVINAFATGFLDNRKTVVLHSALVEAMDRDELIFIIGHEFSHIKCDHTNWLVLTNTAENIAKIPVISDIIGFVFLLWSRKCEYTCDRGGLLASHNLKASISALAKLAVGKELFAKMSLDALLDQKKDIDASEISKISELFETHPHHINRIHELKKFHQSQLYRKLIVE